MFPFRDNTSLSNFLLISIVEAKSFVVVQFPDFLWTAYQNLLKIAVLQFSVQDVNWMSFLMSPKFCSNWQFLQQVWVGSLLQK